ncbi:MAG TPA: SDR family NAD(P)-dependent oxidoreductase, partial [Thermoanaerobaculia bacterium]|nr:SDR family NAD(P)-dependent oxidoreductase [Thermoanaerobaculia bacterium]
MAKIKAAKLQEPGRGSLLVTPVWETSAVAAGHAGYAEHHVILCDLAVDPKLLKWNCTSLRGGQDQSIAERYSDDAVACFERIQTILRGKPQGQVLVQIVAGNDGEHALLAGLSALLKTAALENPRITGQFLLVPADITADTLARHLEDEKSGGRDPVIHYHGGVRQVPRWQEIPAETEPSPIAFQDDGVYLITGGMGGLGMLFAEEILERTGQARVVLAGRSPGPSESRARVSYAQVDVSDLAQVTRLFATIREEHGQLNGILHCAGMVADNFILKKSVDEFRDVLAPKVSGTFHLDQASRDVELDFFVLFSSTAAALGNPGQADYACANGFLDAFAAYRNGLVALEQRHGRTRSIDWPLWQAGG